MKKAIMLATALVCATLIVAGTASAQPVAGFSPSLADPQPTTSATLSENANRLIRWQGWLDVDAFSASVLEQMQKQLGNGIEVGKFTLEEPSINKAVVAAAKDPNIKNFKMNANLNEGEELTNPKLYVWTYRHNYTDKGLYQLYVSVKGKMKIGTGEQIITPPPVPPVLKPHRDIQSLGYEFGSDLLRQREQEEERIETVDIIADVEIWRGAVVKVTAKGEIDYAGNEGGVVVGPEKDEPVDKDPISRWEKAPSLEGNANYDPKAATGPEYVEPLERKKALESNDVQKATGSVPKAGGDHWQDAQEQGRRVKTVPLPQYRRFLSR